MYNALTGQLASLKLNLQVKDNQLKRKVQKLAEYEKQIGILKEDCRALKLQAEELKSVIADKVSDAAEILSRPEFTQAKPFYTCQANVIKSLRGGGGNFYFSNSG